MEDKTRIQEELKFLKESLDAEVITKQEYDSRKSELENKLRMLEDKSSSNILSESTDKKDDKSSSDDVEIKLKEEQKSDNEHLKIGKVKKDNNLKNIEDIKETDKKDSLKGQDLKEQDNEKKDKEDILDYVKVVDMNNRKDKESKKNKTLVPIFLLILLALIVFFSLSLINNTDNSSQMPDVGIEPACFLDEDCKQEGMIGSCDHPGEHNAECSFRNPTSIEVLILNTEDCFNCDTSRVLSILKGWFPGIIEKQITLDSGRGEKLADDLDIELLPAFIFNSSLKETYNFFEFSDLFREKENYYILSPTASAANYYINRQEIPFRFEVFLAKDDPSTEKTRKNLQELIDLFKEKVDYVEHVVTRDELLVRQLNINTFPTYLINNKLKFSGILPADTIKNNFCKLNNLDLCSKKLSESLI